MLVTITVALAAVAVLAAIVVVAVGGGGELSVEHPDHPPLALPARRPVAGTDAALLHLPLGLWGYHKQITDEALERFAQELTERDTRIAVLEQQLAEAHRRLSADEKPGSGGQSALTTRVDEDASRDARMPEPRPLPSAAAAPTITDQLPARSETASAEGRLPARSEDASTGDRPPAWRAGTSDAPADSTATVTDHDPGPEGRGGGGE